MQSILSRITKSNTAPGSTISFSHRIESAEVRDSGDYTLLAIKHRHEYDSYDQATVAQLFKQLHRTEYSLRSLIVNVEDNQELSVFKSEKFYLNNDYTAVCHVFSNLPTTLIWKWSNCRTDQECEDLSSWKIVQSGPTSFPSEESGNSESLFKIIAINNEQVSAIIIAYLNALTNFN